jgi:hypothetical protein
MVGNKVSIAFLARRLRNGREQAPQVCGDSGRFGSDVDYSEFEADGTLVFHGEATVWRDELQSLIIQPRMNPASRLALNLAEGALTYKSNALSTDYATMNTQLNHDWAGTQIRPHLHWWQTTIDMPHWVIEYRWQVNGDAQETIWTPAKHESNAFLWTGGTLNQITRFPDVSPPAGYSLSDIVQIRLIRDTTNAIGLFTGNDPVAVDVDAVNFDVHIEINTTGSREELVK